MEASDAAATCMSQNRAGEKVKEEVAAGEDAGIACAVEPGLIFGFHGDPLLGLDIDECWELPSLADAGLFDEESQRIDEAVHINVCQFNINIMSLHWPRWRLKSWELG